MKKSCSVLLLSGKEEKEEEQGLGSWLQLGATPTEPLQHQEKIWEAQNDKHR